MLETVADIENPKYDFAKFETIRILSNNTNRKTISVLGKFPDVSETDQAVVLLEKKAFTDNNGLTSNVESYFSPNTELKTAFINNIYGSYEAHPPSDINSIKTTIVYPATAKHIEKYAAHEKYIVYETPDLYKNITEPYLKSGQFSIEWLYNILEHKKEKERIMFEDEDDEIGFVLLPDLKWDGKTVETLYGLAIVRQRNIKSLRDLNASHLRMLMNIRDKGCEAISKLHGLDRSQLRIYVHYQPSFYHFHVHFTALKHEAPGIFCEKSHLLDTVINNIELLSDYYQKATLPFILYEGNKLFDKFEEELRIRKRTKIENNDLRKEQENET